MEYSRQRSAASLFFMSFNRVEVLAIIKFAVTLVSKKVPNFISNKLQKAVLGLIMLSFH